MVGECSRDRVKRVPIIIIVIMLLDDGVLAAVAVDIFCSCCWQLLLFVLTCSMLPSCC
jgi:hypothetical protein